MEQNKRQQKMPTLDLEIKKQLEGIKEKKKKEKKREREKMKRLFEIHCFDNSLLLVTNLEIGQVMNDHTSHTS